MKTRLFLLITIVIMLSSCNSSVKEYRIETDGPEEVDFRVLPFDLTQVKLLDGRFKHATELNKKILLDYEPDRFLATFRMEAGLEPKAEHYRGWEDYPRRNLNGHSLGHYMSALSMMYNTTGEQEFLERLNYIVDELALCQEANGGGYLGALPGAQKVFEEEIAKGEIRSAGFDLNGYWAPFYIMHKILAGLNDAYLLCGNEKALDIALNFANWIRGIVTPLNDEQVQKMLHCEHGGINESFAELYAITGEEKYLETARIFHHKAILDSLAHHVDVLPGKHGNTQIPKLIGLARLYELTGNKQDRETAEFFWDRVVHHHSYVTGGHGFNEYFGEPDQLSDRLGEGTTETCNVYNMLKLSRHIFMWKASAEVADYYERALFNHIHASQHPETGHVIYNLSLAMGGAKNYQNPGYFTCCVGTGMENHAKYARNIYFHNDKELYISQYIASELKWDEKGLEMVMETSYPDEQGATISFNNEEPVDLIIQVRYPSWAEEGIEILVNGRKKNVRQEPGNFVPVKGSWKAGDSIEISIPFTLRLESMPDDSSRVAIMHGPVVLAGDLGPENDPDAYDAMYVPVLVTENRPPEEWLKPVEDEPNAFMMDGVGQPRDVKLIPFYDMHNRRYTVYWDIFTMEEWEKKKEDYRLRTEKMKEMEQMTVDFAQPGQMQPERDHNFKSEDSRPVRFRGRDVRNTNFEILVNDRVIATETIDRNDGDFISISYPIPRELTVGKFKATVKFRAVEERSEVGPVYGVRIIRRKQEGQQ
ncbi:MAG: glycoside hydrolase family 127 protein [Bacteroidota bacterium]|nr:glycoside hydrolase family 127 protein [Bacteroidota bacterium]